uniref:Uncharacterized protein n=1 Tax=Anguilla anguilla TaxID=7936 RepID=A0A0E9XK39_ANGAN
MLVDLVTLPQNPGQGQTYCDICLEYSPHSYLSENSTVGVFCQKKIHVLGCCLFPFVRLLDLNKQYYKAIL